MLAAPSGTPRSVTVHVLATRGSCITVAEDRLAEDAAATLPVADWLAPLKEVICSQLALAGIIPAHLREVAVAVDEEEDDESADAEDDDDEDDEEDEDDEDDDEKDEAAAIEIVCVCTSVGTAGAATTGAATPRARCAGYNG